VRWTTYTVRNPITPTSVELLRCSALSYQGMRAYSPSQLPSVMSVTISHKNASSSSIGMPVSRRRVRMHGTSVIPSAIRQKPP